MYYRYVPVWIHSLHMSHKSRCCKMPGDSQAREEASVRADPYGNSSVRKKLSDTAAQRAATVHVKRCPEILIDIADPP